jgi:hypothetical protein
MIALIVALIIFLLIDQLWWITFPAVLAGWALALYPPWREAWWNPTRHVRDPLEIAPTVMLVLTVNGVVLWALIAWTSIGLVWLGAVVLVMAIISWVWITIAGGWTA